MLWIMFEVVLALAVVVGALTWTFSGRPPDDLADAPDDATPPPPDEDAPHGRG